MNAATLGFRILLIEDSDDILFLTVLQLERMGHTVTAVADSRLALEAASTHPPDLIISDIRMPHMDGYELIRAIRDVPELSGTPAIALTGFGDKMAMERALAAGFNACLSKPAGPEQIAALISQLTGRAAHAGPNTG
jgi:CheY-like chemotaxis protein